MCILFFQLTLLVSNPRFMLTAAFDLGHVAPRSTDAEKSEFSNNSSPLKDLERKESQGTDDVQINKSLSPTAVNMTETAPSHKATNASVHRRRRRRRRNDYDDIYKWQEEEYEEDDEEEIDEYFAKVGEPTFLQRMAKNWQIVGLRLILLGSPLILFCAIFCCCCRWACKIWCSTFQESCCPCCPQALKDIFKSFYTDPMYEKVRELGEAFGVEITFTTFEKIKEHYGAEGQYDEYHNPLGLPYM